jgi:hypothetical protein
MPRHLHPDGQAEFLNQQGLGAACESCGSGKLSVTVWDHYGTAPKVARHSNPAAKKRLLGNEMFFYGGIDVQETLPYGTVEEVRAEVRARI